MGVPLGFGKRTHFTLDKVSRWLLVSQNFKHISLPPSFIHGLLSAGLAVYSVFPSMSARLAVSVWCGVWLNI